MNAPKPPADLVGFVAYLFTPEAPLWQPVLRATLMYLLLFSGLRFLLKRQGGVMGVPDLLVLLMVVDAAQQSVTGDASSITETGLTIATVFFWTWALNWLSFRVPRLAFLTAPPPVELVKHGRVNRRNLRAALMTQDELMMQLREQGVDDLAQVEECYMEGDGEVSVVEVGKD